MVKQIKELKKAKCAGNRYTFNYFTLTVCNNLLDINSMVSEKNLSQSVSSELKINLNGKLTKLVYTFRKTANGNSFDTFEGPSCLRSIFWWLQANYCFLISVVGMIPTTFS